MSDIEAAERVSLGDLLSPVRGPLIAACVVQAIGAVAGIIPYIAVAEVGRELIGDADSDRLWRLVLMAGVALAIRISCFFGANGITHIADNSFQLALRRRIAAHIGQLPLGWFEERDAGEVKKLVNDDVAALHPIVGHTFIDITNAAVTAVASMVYLFTVDWRMALVAMIPFVVGVGLYSRQMSGYGEKMEEYNQAMTDVNNASVEFVQGIAVVKTFGQTGRAHRRYARSTSSFVETFWNWVKGMLRLASVSDIVLSPPATPTDVVTESVIENVFGLPVQIIDDPVTGSPLCVAR